MQTEVTKLKTTIPELRKRRINNRLDEVEKRIRELKRQSSGTHLIKATKKNGKEEDHENHSIPRTKMKTFSKGKATERLKAC